MDKALEIILAVVIIGSTLAFGGVQPLASSLMEITLFAAVLLLLWKQTREGTIKIPLPVWPLLFALWVAVEIVPLPRALVAGIAPARLLKAIPAGPVPASEAWATLSIYPHATFLAWARMLAYFSAFLLAAHVFHSRKRRSLLVEVLIFLGLFEAAYGIVQYLTGWQKIFTYTKVYYTEEASGTYINHNHFAGFLELTLPFILASTFYSFQTWSERRRLGRARRSPAEARVSPVESLFFFFLLVIMIVAVIYSRSRTGILAALFSVVFVGLLAQLKSRRRMWMAGLSLFLVIAVGYGLWIGLGPVLERFEQIQGPQYLQVEGRLEFWSDAARLLRDYPWTGTGLGTFAVGFRHYQTAWVNYFVDHPHNDYLEFASETGLPGAALLFLPILYLLVRMMVSFLYDPRRYRPAVLLGCIGSTLAILIHSVTDFNLQIPANALVFAVVLGLGYKAALIEQREEQAQPEREVAREPLRTASRSLSR